jgi:hypothetical protein
MHDYDYDTMLDMSKYWNRARKEYYVVDDLRLPYLSGIGTCHDYYLLMLRCLTTS